jgi:hypothetical protein
MAPIVGFDFDECLSYAYSIMPIILFLEHLLVKELRVQGISAQTREAMLVARANFYNAVAENEVATKGLLIRPSFLRVLPTLLKMRSKGEIQSLFIYSNNTNSTLINVVDHILALTLVKLGVPEAHLLSEPYGSVKRLQTMSPRLFRGSECRSEEPLRVEFKEKTLAGVLRCVGLNVPESDVWFLDDSSDHKSLMSSLKTNYLQMKRYEAQLKNTRLTELLISSFNKDAFNPMVEMGIVFLKAYSSLETHFIVVPPGEKYLIRENPRFNPKATDDLKKIAEKLKTSLNAVSPSATGRPKMWTTVETNTDYAMIMKRLEQLVNPKKKSTGVVAQPSELDAATATATAYREPFVGGRQSSKRSPVSSRSRKKRLFTRRRKT